MIENKENEKKITGLKVAKYAFTALAGVASLITTPISTGIAIAAGLGSVIADITLENKIDNNKLAAAK